MQGALVAVGPSSADEIAPRIEGTLSNQSVNGDNFELPAPTEKRMHADKGNATHPVWKGGLVTIFTANPDYLDVKFSTSHWNCFGGQMNSAPAIYEYHPQNTKLEGTAEVKRPTHVFLRAFIRIR
jgi:hypothetical protein